MGDTVLCFLLLITSVPEDVKLHVAASTAITSLSYTVCRTALKGDKTTCRIVSFISTMAIGLAKEAMDGRNNTEQEHLKDMGSDLVGFGFGTFITMPF